MKKTFTILFFIMYSSILFGQHLITGTSGRNESTVFGQTQLFIHSWEEPTIKKVYNEGVFLQIRCNQFYTDTSKILQFNSLIGKHKIKDSILTVSLSGVLRKVTDSSLTIAVRNESVKINYGNGLYTDISNIYFQDPCDIQTGINYGDELRTINFSKINNIGSTDVKKGFGFVSVVMGISAFSALIVAPLVSINYRNGNFNQKRYYAVTLSSLAVLSVGIPILLFKKDDKYYNIKAKKTDTLEAEYFLDNK